MLEDQAKFSVLPLFYWDPQFEVDAPISLSNNLTLRSFKDFFKAEDFDLWKDHLAEEFRKKLSSTSVGVEHTYHGRGWHDSEDMQSSSLIYILHVGLRLVRPSRSPYYMLQYRLEPNRGTDIMRFQRPDRDTEAGALLNVPDGEVLNFFHLSHVRRAVQLLPKLQSQNAEGSKHLSRAISYYEEGYSGQRDPVMQFLSWMMGIEAAIRVGPTQPQKLVRAYLKDLFQGVDLYAELREERDYLHVPVVLVNEMIDDLFALRNTIVHGRPVEGPRFEGILRNSISGQPLQRAEGLRETASFVLRHLILKQLENF